MPQVTFNYKPKNEKLLRIILQYDNDRIQQVKIFGDYFLYPEEAIFEIEQGLTGVKLKRDEILDVLKNKFKELGVTAIGISEESICEGILLAYTNGKAV